MLRLYLVPKHKLCDDDGFSKVRWDPPIIPSAFFYLWNIIVAHLWIVKFLKMLVAYSFQNLPSFIPSIVFVSVIVLPTNLKGGFIPFVASSLICLRVLRASCLLASDLSIPKMRSKFACLYESTSMPCADNLFSTASGTSEVKSIYMIRLFSSC